MRHHPAAANNEAARRLTSGPAALRWAMVRLDNGAANGQSHAHAAILGAEKALKICSRSSSRTQGRCRPRTTAPSGIGGGVNPDAYLSGRLAPWAAHPGVYCQVGDYMLQQQTVGLHPYGAPGAAWSAG